MKTIIMGLFVIAILLSSAVCPLASAGDAMDQLQGMSNTGTTFDGSDGRRSGMDIDFVEVEGPEIPEPTAVPVDEEY